MDCVVSHIRAVVKAVAQAVVETVAINCQKYQFWVLLAMKN